MKRRITSLIFVLCFITISFINNAYASVQQEYLNKHGDIVSTITVMSGDQLIFEVSSTDENIDLLTEKALELLKSEEESEVSPYGTFCCEPNQPTRPLRFYFHIVLNDGFCVTYYQDTKQCLSCGSVYPLGPKQNELYHPTTSSCL